MRLFLFLIGLVAQIPLGWHLFYGQKLPLYLQDSGKYDEDIIPAADQFFKYYHFIKGKRLGLVINHTSMVGEVHLVDTLLRMNCSIQKIFAPEHGFRGNADAGEKFNDGIDKRTKIPIVSLYGNNRKPNAEQMKDLDLVIFDIQDVGARFYTYTSTMTYIMEACAEHKIPLLILDRPNPNGHYVDGPVLDSAQKSFVGLHPVPIVHGLTVAEYARMINEEGWLSNGLKCELYHVECLNYNHSKMYKLPIKPSPNLPNMQSIYLYPSLCLFEGTTVSIGRGTQKQFQIYGHPNATVGDFTFTPTPQEGAKEPPHKGLLCKGYDLSIVSTEELQKNKELNLNYLIDFYNHLNPAQQADFFLKTKFFHSIAGTKNLQTQIENKTNIAEIRKSWQPKLNAYKALRKKYLLYKDFE